MPQGSKPIFLPEPFDTDEALAAIDRLDGDGSLSLRMVPPVDPGVSGRPAPAGGPSSSAPDAAPLQNLGLMLDEELVDELLLADGPSFSIPVEMALVQRTAPATLGPVKLVQVPADEALESPPAARAVPGPSFDAARSTPAAAPASGHPGEPPAMFGPVKLVQMPADETLPPAARAVPSPSFDMARSTPTSAPALGHWGEPPAALVPSDTAATIALAVPRAQAAPPNASAALAAGHRLARDSEQIPPPAFLLEPPLKEHRSAQSGALPDRPRPVELAEESGQIRSNMPAPKEMKGGEMMQATMPISGGGFGIGDDESDFGSDGRGRGGGSPLGQRVQEFFRVDETIEAIRDWLWRIQPYLHGLASLVLPGWGQSLNGQPAKARVFRTAAFATLVTGDLLLFRERVAMLVSLAVTLEASSITRWLGPVFLAGVFVWLLAAYDAYVVCTTRRAAETRSL